MRSVTCPSCFIPVRDMVLIEQEAGWAPGAVWTGVENLTPTGVRSPVGLAHGESLLRYPGSQLRAVISQHSENIIIDFRYRIHSFSILSDDRSKASSKTMPPHNAIQSLRLQMRISSPVLKVIQ